MNPITEQTPHGTEPVAPAGIRWAWPWVVAGLSVPSAAVLVFVVLIPAVGMHSAPDLTNVSLASRATHVAWLEGRLEAARAPQPALSIDLADTTHTGAATVVLSMSGVPVRTMRAERAYLDGLAHVPASAPAHAFRLHTYASDIPHVPVREVIAPADTVEAARRPPPDVPAPDVPDYAVLQYDGLEVRLVTEGIPGFGYWMDTLSMRLGQRGLVPVLRIALPAEDIRAIYRALQEDSMLALRLPRDAPTGDAGQVESSR